MRVICTTTEVYICGKGVLGGTSVIRGSIYNVINVLSADQIAEKHWDFTQVRGRPAAGDWYELLELAGHHHCSKFLELPDDLFESSNTQEHQLLENL